MDDTNRLPPADEPFFRALLTPHRSLGRTGFTILMGTLIFGWLATGALFLSQGAWPVFGFFGLDVLLVYVAFRAELPGGAGARRGVGVAHRARHPQDRAVRADRASTISTRSGHASRSPATRRSASPGCRSRRRASSVSIGGFLNPDDRESFAAAFSQALATAKAG